MHRSVMFVMLLVTLAVVVIACRKPPSEPQAGTTAKQSATVTQVTPVRTQMIAFRPPTRPWSQQRMAQLKLPEGFTINVFASNLGHARMLAVADDGTVYLTCPSQDRVMELKDADGDGQAESVRSVLEGLEKVHGIAIHGGRLYLAAPTRLWVVDRDAKGQLGKPRLLIDDLPDGGQHPNRTLGFGPDGKLYISVGSTCNACDEPNPESATILIADADGRNRRVFARGLRNTIGFDWHPRTGQLWGWDHGSDGRGNDLPPEELNLLENGKDYGWPYVFGRREIDPIMPDPEKPKTTKQQYAQGTEPSVLDYQAHSAPIGFVFYRGEQFPQRYRTGGFVCFRGSWNRDPATGYKVGFVVFDQKGRPTSVEDFVSGFLIEEGKANFGRLAGIAVATDGSLLFTDDANGVMYRVSYSKTATGT